MTSEENLPADKDWTRDQQKIAVLSWISFLAAGAFSFPLFALVDPLFLVDAVGLDADAGRNAGYAIGFFFLWVHGWVSGWLVLRLVRRKRNWPRRP